MCMYVHIPLTSVSLVAGGPLAKAYSIMAICLWRSCQSLKIIHNRRTSLLRLSPSLWAFILSSFFFFVFSAVNVCMD